MVFNSYIFLLFFPIVVVVYHFIPDKIRPLWLLAASYYFYMSWNVKYAALILISTVVTYFTGRFIEKYRERNASAAFLRALLAGCLSVNLGILFFFKYFTFFFRSIEKLFSAMGIAMTVPAFDVVLPVGISFYTFQALGYCIDVYKGEIRAERSFLQYALFVSFFPQLVAGPIERSGNLLNQLRTFKPVSYEHLRDGVFLMLWGYFQKIVVADRIAVYVDSVYDDPAAYPGVYLIIATILFAFQIYCDFGGYSNIAKGAAEILGIELMNNFASPYLSLSCGEFWKRWHISLSSWFRDYVYIPMGGNRKGRLRKYLNVMIVFGLSGLWHGANWTYVIWGLLNGFFQVLGDLTRPLKRALNRVTGSSGDHLAGKIAKILFTFLLIDFAWVFFRAGSVANAVTVIRSMFTVFNPWVLFDDSLFLCGLTCKESEVLILSLLLLIGVDIANYNGVTVRRRILKQDYWFRTTVFAVSVCAILIFGIWGTGYESDAFLYFQF